MSHSASDRSQLGVRLFDHAQRQARIALVSLLVPLIGCEHLEAPEMDYGSLQGLVCREDTGADCSIMPCCEGLACSVNHVTGEERCRLECDESSDCPDDQACIVIEIDEPSVCTQCSAVGNPCMKGCCDGLTCVVAEDGGNMCVPICKNDADCKEGERCVNIHGATVDACRAY